jgi:phenylalanyl-tRNA synthetase beta chain
MQFSYSLLKKFVPKLPPRNALIEKLNLHVFESEPGEGDMIDISLPANRYSDAGSYQGLAKIIGATLNLKTIFSKLKTPKDSLKKNFSVSIKDPDFCRRMTARYIEGVAVRRSPKWLVDTLKIHGMRSINNVVDITNYVMLETGQPTHVFDFDKMTPRTLKQTKSKQVRSDKVRELIVRRAKAGERIQSLDGEKFKLTDKVHVLADSTHALDIAAIKGGTKAELNQKTKNILLTAGSFDGVTIYNSSRAINLSTDASVRFSHNLSPILAEIGNNRAAELILELCGGKTGPLVDVFPRRPKEKIIKFKISEFNELTGLNISESRALTMLKRLGFKIKKNLVHVPGLRTDVLGFEDLVEEVAVMYGYNNIKSQSPTVAIASPSEEAVASLRTKTRDLLVNFGCDEVYNYSFVSERDLKDCGGVKWWRGVMLENALSKTHAFLRPSLVFGLLKNAKENLRFFDSVKIFELGQKFNTDKSGVVESNALGIALAYRKKSPILELKGIVEAFLKQLGINDLNLTNPTFDLPYMKSGETLFVDSGGDMLGYFGMTKDSGLKRQVAVAEFDLGKLDNSISGKKKYLPILKYPSVTRDVSLFISSDVRIGDVLIAMQKSAPNFLQDADLIDYYLPSDLPSEADRNKKSLAFRLIFQAEDRTLTDAEVNGEIEKITEALEKNFSAEVR